MNIINQNSFGLLIILLLLIFSTKTNGQNIADYNISVSLDPESKIVSGEQTLTWTNTSLYPTSELQFHMYLNAFKSPNTTFMLGSGGALRNDVMDTSKPENFGYINLDKIVLNEQTELTNRQSYIQPDNLNQNDHTVLKIDLPRPVRPGETIRLTMSFTSKLPKVFARTGWAAHEYFLVGQWFPKIGVLEKDGTWNCHQFHADTEFYANFGNYIVNITLPKRFKTGGTGLKITETPLKNDLKQVTFSAENVHDFAWAASPYFMEATDKYRGTEIKILMQPEQRYLFRRYLNAIKRAMDYMENHVGEYPHPIITLVNPSLDGAGSGGMEYPTFITGGAAYGIGPWYKYQELVTIHEFVHQYFQGILANNEFEHSWMDEGFTQYFEDRVMKYAFPKGSVFGFTHYPITSLVSSRLSYTTMDNPEIAPIMMNAWQYPRGSYPILTYTKPATALATLENLLGQQLMDEVIQTYFKKFQFKHPRPEDFFNTANEVVARSGKFENLDWFFDQVFRGTGTCDYTVTDLENKNGKGSARIKNLGSMNIPVKVKITFSDGKSEIINWNGENRQLNYPKEIRSIHIDPDQHNLLDLDLINNSMTVKKKFKAESHLLFTIIFWIQNLFV